MKLTNNYYLTYCTNIHAGESWKEVKESLENFLPKIKEKSSPNQPLGVGLRLSGKASEEILTDNHLAEFKAWLSANDYYVFTLNGFPYGGFHNTRVKDDVHKPDWTTTDRLDYTKRLFDVLSVLLPENQPDGGISTSPASYKYWYKTEEELNEAFKQSVIQYAEVAIYLAEIKALKNQNLHLDIEPEPDGLIENTQETIDFYKNWLIPVGSAHLVKTIGISPEEAKRVIMEHIQICYDVCHFAVEYEEPQSVFEAFEKEGIKIGKIQISAALKAHLPKDQPERKLVEGAFLPFVESTYLHQVIAKKEDGKLINYNDLPAALENFYQPDITEWRTHFHVPIFLKEYGKLYSTQDEIEKVLAYIQTNHITNHLEVETYTWEVLPKDIQINLADSISRELNWVKDTFNQKLK
ncbi:metabolite traffic protein EboE [Flexithrix dorotheae]|uniref:metabolite traffic protein EboE n=1 Tax=Flexithrix dorotheae TaxID=70993 RepID=UPI00036AE3A8|nr:metabolite traffic protein EboE [Flexithrix dorotheae]